MRLRILGVSAALLTLLTLLVWEAVKEGPVVEAPNASIPTKVPELAAEKSTARPEADAASDSFDQKPWLAPTRTELAEQLEELFGEPSEGRSKIPFTAQELANEELQLKHRKLDYQLTLAVDSGVDLRSLEAYGIVVNADRTVSIDNDLHPRWSLVDSVLGSLRGEGLTLRLDELRRRGFSEEEVKGVQERAQKDSWPAIQASVASLYQDFLDEINGGSLSPEAEDERARRLVYEFNMSTTVPRIRWAIGILEPLDEAKKEILLGLVRESRSSHTTIFPKDPDSGAQGAIEAARSGEMLKQIEAFKSGRKS
jgi:hypothetical protein